ncbi:hypothetical protein K402DRAFT_390308 [Aulographum hederae CBS 113979]|uniref:Uncharacterized protein n=1 Tax=Aulographum hederae CBS 113979 TaxID=1176131 RepID=A0A6G1HAK0_9PEZI|nr:hypothetical protein K402DRAFT_390308 [Aulographum hederae CBS 113979]
MASFRNCSGLPSLSTISIGGVAKYGFSLLVEEVCVPTFLLIFHLPIVDGHNPHVPRVKSASKEAFGSQLPTLSWRPSPSEVHIHTTSPSSTYLPNQPRQARHGTIISHFFRSPLSRIKQKSQDAKRSLKLCFAVFAKILVPISRRCHGAAGRTVD